ncbi:MAG: hypothetical protein FWC69_00535 [Defluviitaleaceae bacterium]|nr:hypothetical protein [Defluviitaleaceae bacterium]
MSKKMQNRVRRVFYRPARKRSALCKNLSNAEKTLSETVGGIFARRKRRR